MTIPAYTEPELVGNRWVWPNGRTLPAARGGSDDGTSAPPAVSAAPPATEPAQQQVDWEAKYRAEVEDRIKERERYKPFAQSLGALDDQTRAAILDLTEAVAVQDFDRVTAWTEGTYRNLTGGDLATAIAQRQQAGTAAPAAQQGIAAPPPPPEVTPDYINDVVARQVEERLRIQTAVQQIRTELTTAGYQPESAAGQTIIGYARQTGKPIGEAVAWFEADVQQQIAARAAAAAQAAGQVPPPAPAGTPPAMAAVGATPRDKAINRLLGQQGGPGN